MELEKELKFYERKKEEFLKEHENQFVLIKDEKVIGFYNSPEEAYDEGAKLFGLEPFFIKEVVRNEQIESIPALTYGLTNASI
ncbi:MAG: DUF5678 domain-containing protein [Candidatus Omnitrophica bacterium]|nr:DUF5678 domain-containing protein [Candidatus Omnitrophota bacterium]